MQRSNSRVFLGFICSAIASVAAAGLPQANKPLALPKSAASLIDSSTRVVDLSVLRSWLAQHYNVPVEALDGVNWLSQEEIIAHDNHADGAFMEAYQLNLRTGDRLRLPKLTQAIGGRGYLKPGKWKLSPDRKWLLWRSGWLEKQYSLIATQIDGSCSVRWTAPKATQDAHLDSYFWIPGTHKWVNLYSANDKTVESAQVYDLDAPHALRTIPLATLHIGTHFLGCLPDGTIWTADDFDRIDKGRRATVTAFRLETPSRLHRYILLLPKGESIQQTAMSPTGRTLATLTASPNEDSYTLWRSAPDGSGLRRVAGLIFRKGDVRIGLVSWTPDGKSLLFDVERFAQGGEQGSYQLREIAVR